MLVVWCRMVPVRMVQLNSSCQVVKMVYDCLIEGGGVIFNLQLCIYSIASFFQNTLRIY